MAHDIAALISMISQNRCRGCFGADRPPRRPNSPDVGDQRHYVYLEASLRVLKELNRPVPTRVPLGSISRQSRF